MEFLKTPKYCRKTPVYQPVINGSKQRDQIASYSPVDGKLIGSVSSADRASYDATVQTAISAFHEWRLLACPETWRDQKRQVGDELRKFKEPLGKPVSW